MHYLINCQNKCTVTKITSGLPIDMHDSPDEKPGMDEDRAELPEDVDVMEDPPGEEDNSVELAKTGGANVVEQSIVKEQGESD